MEKLVTAKYICHSNKTITHENSIVLNISCACCSRLFGSILYSSIRYLIGCDGVPQPVLARIVHGVNFSVSISTDQKSAAAKKNANRCA